MADVRTQLVTRVRGMLSEALGATRTRLAAAEAELTASRERLARTRRAAAAVPARVGAARDRRLAEIDARHTARLAELARRAAAAAQREAPGAASAPWDRWQATPAGRAEPPGALRVGTVRLRRRRAGAGAGPAARRRARAPGRRRPCRAGRRVVPALLLRSVGRADPGAVRLYGYDPEHLGGGLAGFAPLGTAGLLTFVGPGGLGRLLDDLVEQIRRINATVLAGEYGSLRELAAATGRRPEPWRVAVLLGGDELSRHERGQLDRVVRTGAACGVHLVVRGIELPDDPTVDPDRGASRTTPGVAGLPVRARRAAAARAGHRDLPRRSPPGSPPARPRRPSPTCCRRRTSTGGRTRRTGSARRSARARTGGRCCSRSATTRRTR